MRWDALTHGTQEQRTQLAPATAGRRRWSAGAPWSSAARRSSKRSDCAQGQRRAQRTTTRRSRTDGCTGSRPRARRGGARRRKRGRRSARRRPPRRRARSRTDLRAARCCPTPTRQSRRSSSARSTRAEGNSRAAKASAEGLPDSRALPGAGSRHKTTEHQPLCSRSATRKRAHSQTRPKLVGMHRGYLQAGNHSDAGRRLVRPASPTSAPRLRQCTTRGAWRRRPKATRCQHAL